MGVRGRFIAVACVLPLTAVALASIEAAAVAPTLLFGVVLIAASLCAVAAAALALVAHRNDQAELGLVSSFFFATSVLPLVHGITVPSVLYGPNSATMTSVFLAVPAGLVGVAPSLIRNTSVGRGIGRRWRLWVLGHATATTALGVLLLAVPDIRLHPDVGSTGAWISAFALFAGTVAVGQRHAWLAEVAGRPGPVVIGAGFVLVGLSTFAFIDTTPYSVWFWLAHAIDITGVFLATIGGFILYRNNSNVGEVAAPVLAVDPHAALELAVSPIMHRFVADLESKDPITRDHVVRTADLAVDVAVELGLPSTQVRRAGLAALLHDIGKLEIPDEILTKPGRLDDDEFATMQTHTKIGGAMLEAAPGLSSLAGPVRGHHERFDGNGYPDGLAGDAIPIEARVVSACDAYDAMANTRHYRTGLEADKVRAILAEHRGSQWDPAVVDALLAVVGRKSPAPVSRLDGVGQRHVHADREFGCACLPEEVLAAG